MSDSELDELDAWIFKILGIENATFEKARSMAVLEKCADVIGPVKLYKRDSNEWMIDGNVHGNPVHVEAETLPICICLFAKQMYHPK